MGLTRIISGYFEVILFLSKALWYTPAPRTLRQEFGDSLGYTARLCLTNKTNRNE